LLVSRQGFTAVVECKLPGEKLTPDQRKFIGEWQGAFVIAYDPEGAADELRIEYEYRMSKRL
jgi:hypothetical protein